ncbi:hypothetical protein [Alkalihalobacillus sp. AL-G]|uniref:hypothetical protein n=1 Tax=Alkalihalobacillus sp. AL-G TaxID=2926399 RepID=UPI00272B34F2|nr:hypothetical protein [Alkalihalobacillus sp. AL-G]WLD94556.1 hypothetical protein MOJ78_06645 [Alkalihalobacillus sp. AL-G]
MKDSFIAISIFSLAIAIIIGSWLISNGSNDKKVQFVHEETSDLEKNKEKQLLTQSEFR